jgi:hypothetical protein
MSPFAHHPEGAPRRDSSLWRVSTVDSGHALGVVVAETYEEALGKAIRLAARTDLPPQALHVQLESEVPS